MGTTELHRVRMNLKEAQQLLDKNNVFICDWKLIRKSVSLQLMVSSFLRLIGFVVRMNSGSL